jgi:hypothetical protein
VGGFKYFLIFANQATCYNWVFGLKDLSSVLIHAASRLFRADAGSYAWCFWCDCDAKPFGTKIQEISLTMTPTLLLQQQAVSLLTALWNLIGRLWSTWSVQTSQKNKCLGHSGSM